MEMKNVNNLKLVLLCIPIFKCVRLQWQLDALKTATFTGKHTAHLTVELMHQQTNE